MCVYFIAMLVSLLDMSDDAVKRLRDDLTNKAMLYLEQVCVKVLHIVIFCVNIHDYKGKDTEE